MPDTTAGQITLAQLGVKMDYMAAQLHELTVKVDAIKTCQDQMSVLPAVIKDMRDDVDALQIDMEGTKQKVTIIAGLNAILSGLLGALGIKF